MKSKENLVFLGMMGSGKSSIGSLVAKKLKLDFIDVDKEIEKELGLTISKIFETKGEDYFRKYEEKITLKILKLNTVVVSLGGGAFVNKIIRKEILKNHISFWLNWDNKILVNRIKNSKKIQPRKNQNHWRCLHVRRWHPNRKFDQSDEFRYCCYSNSRLYV